MIIPSEIKWCTENQIKLNGVKNKYTVLYWTAETLFAFDYVEKYTLKGPIPSILAVHFTS